MNRNVNEATTRREGERGFPLAVAVTAFLTVLAWSWLLPMVAGLGAAWAAAGDTLITGTRPIWGVLWVLGAGFGLF